MAAFEGFERTLVGLIFKGQAKTTATDYNPPIGCVELPSCLWFNG